MNNFICEIVLSVHGNDKINVDGFLMVKDKSCNNAFYCVKEHTHSAQASQAEVVKMIARIKDQAQLTREKPAQVLQTVITDSPQYV
ncbi:27372_t:CDS:2, partial [Gigaspora margarita]